MQLLETASGSSDHRRKELADFIRGRRERLSPEIAGLPHTGRRRTPGLRREEVAELAGISTALYAWLEQGRDVPVSRRTIDAIAAALQLSSSERTHFHFLASREGAELDETVSPTLKQFVCSIETHPIFVLDHAWDIVLRNRAADAVFAHDAALEEPLNLLEAMFTNPKTQSLFPEWRRHAESILELFRYDYAQYAEELRPFQLVEKLRAEDARFDEIWERHRVRRAANSRHTEIDHPVGGRLDFEPSTYAVIESPGLRVFVLTPNNEQTTSRVLTLVSASRDECTVPARENGVRQQRDAIAAR